METNESIVREKAEINLSSFFWSILAQWRIILVFALLFALLLGGVKGVQSYRSLNNTAKQEAAQKKYQEELDAYNIQKAKLELEIETLTQDSLRLQEYEDSSVLFSIDPYHVHVEQALYYISLDHDSFLENALQNDIYTAPLIDAYSVAIARTDIVSLISGLENRAVSNEYGRLASTDANTGGAGAQTVSFLSVSANSDSGVLEVLAIGANEEQARLFLDAAREEMAKVKSSLEESIHQHEIVLLSTKQFQIVSKELIELHNSFLKQTESIDNSLKTNRKELKALKMPQNSAVSSTDIIKASVKYAAIGFLAGAFLALVYEGFRLILKQLLLAADDVWQRYHSALLGVQTIDRQSTRFDRWIAKHRGMIPDSDGRYSSDLIAANVKIVCAGKKSVLLTGSLGTEAFQDLSEKLSDQLGAVKLIPGSNICADPKSVYALAECDGVILTEEIGKSSYADIERELVKIRETGKTLLGFVLVGKARM